ncbi:MAG TPA: sugar transferase [Actinomycetota bacterium]|nr:sugar transferase [Actinomycetota bacterium]
MNDVAPLTDERARAVSVEGLGRRAFDLVVGGMLLVLLLPVIALVAGAVSISTPGPALFRQVRVGRNEERFRMFKFRTMYVDSDDEPHRRFVTSVLSDRNGALGRPGLQKLEHDPRVTKLGAFLRRSSIDELPQLFNVMAGSMSLVGPRPVLPWEAELFAPHHRRRFEVTPGITGLWQVRGRSSLSMLEALDLDVEYVATRSFWLDLAILVKTIPTVLFERTAA